ncbi:MAG: transglycosylase SLT domain-containing protein [Deltaproteobacteria bacterium]|nr:transglycosylase SLT domain-containing protein [Deltaproteobacteria bacterium]
MILLLPLSSSAKGQSLTEGFALFEKKNYGRAIETLKRVKEPELEDYVYYAIGESAHRLKRCPTAVWAFSKIVSEENSPWFVVSLRRLAESYQCLGQWKEARDYWEKYFEETTVHHEKGRARWQVALCDYKGGNREEAVSSLWQYWRAYPETPWADEALSLLGHPSFTPDELFETGKILYQRREFARAAQLFKGPDHPLVNHPEANFWEAESLFREGHYPEAIGLYEGMIKKEKNIGRKRQILSRIASAYARQGETEKALSLQKEILKKFPHSPEGKQAARKIAFLYLDAGLFKEALPHLKRLSKGRGASPLWAQDQIAWSYYCLGEWSLSLQAWKKLERSKESQKALYWQGRIFEKRGDETLAHQYYQKLIEGSEWGYYRFLAADRLSLSVDQWRSFTEHKNFLEPVDLAKVVSPDCPVFNRIQRLHQLRLDDLIFRELAVGKNGCRPVWTYPRIYRSFIEREAKRVGIDPFLVYSLMRQESHFNPGASSPAGAIGLMQLMPQTARRLSREAGWLQFDGSLEDPETNILLALAYLQRLSKEFGKNQVSIIASYNAGEGAISRWRGQRKDLDEEEFIEEIPYTETKDYVKKVLSNYRTYQIIYNKLLSR